MAESPNIYLDDPDPLSVLLSRLELTAEVYVHGEFCGTWAVDTGGSRRIPFHIIGDGEAWLHFYGNTQGLSTGDLVVFPGDEHHVLGSSPDMPPADLINAPMSGDGAATTLVCGFFEFNNPSVFPLLESLPPVVLLRKNQTDGGRVGKVVSLMLEELDTAGPGFYASINELAFLLFIEVIRQEVDTGEVTSGLLAALFDSRIGRALSAMHSNPSHAWNLEELAAEAAMSRSTFAQRFRSLLSVTPMKYLTLWRMNEAKRMLERTDMSIAQISERIGYESEPAFRKAFRQTTGEPPGSHRARYRLSVDG